MGLGIVFFASWAILAIVAFRKKQSAIISLFGTLLCACLILCVVQSARILTGGKSPSTATAIDPLQVDSDAAKIRAKEFVEAQLKAPSTAKWASYQEFATAREQDKKGRVVKDVWNVVGYVDSQNSYGAMLRTKFLVTLKKSGEDWQLLKLSTY